MLTGCENTDSLRRWEIEQAKPGADPSVLEHSPEDDASMDEYYGGGIDEDAYFRFCEYDAVEKRLQEIEHQKKLNQATQWVNRSASVLNTSRLVDVVCNTEIDAIKHELKRTQENISDLEEIKQQSKKLAKKFNEL